MEKKVSTGKIDNDFLLPEYDSCKKETTEIPLKAEPVRELDLSGRMWSVDGIRPGQGVHEGFHEVLPELCPSTFNWMGAEVPGDVYTDLWRAGALDDPHFGRQSMKAKWVMEKEWWYIRRFNLPRDMKDKSLFLEFEGVDYSCDIWFNGVHLGSHEGMFSPFRFDISNLAGFDDTVTGVNGLAIRLNPPPRLYEKVAGRKFAWHGDYWRSLTPIGIWKPIRVKAYDGARIDYLAVDSRVTGKMAELDIRLDLEKLSDTPSEFNVEAVIEGYNFVVPPVKTEVTGTEDCIRMKAVVDDVRLWWPWDMGDQNLYTVTVRVTDKDGNTADEQQTRIGIREIRMERNPGFKEDEVQYPWTMMINGEHHFFRSGAWGGPPDIFYGRNSEEKYRTLIYQAREANLNNLRIFGWHPTEVKEFYDICDEAGITVWQDILPLASVTLSKEPAFKEAVYNEAVAVMKDIRNHPSLVLIEGGEESLYTFTNLEYNRDFLLGMEGAVRPYTNLPYVPASPLAYPETIVTELGFKSKKESVHPHALHYGCGGFLLEDYIAEWDFAVYPEFAAASPPNPESIRKFIPESEVWPPGPSWGHHWADLDVFLSMNYQIFGDMRTGSLEEFVEASQISQGIVFQWGIEHVRRCKPKSTGISICHFITYAPDMKWGIVDYYQETKESYHYVKRAYQPVLVSLKTDKRRWLPGETFRGDVWMVNDTPREFNNCRCQIIIKDSQGLTQMDTGFTVDAVERGCSKIVFSLNAPVYGDKGDSFTVYLEVKDQNNNSLSVNEYMLLIEDQDLARTECKALSDKLKSPRKRFTQSDYYRYFPSLSGKDRKKETGEFSSGVYNI